MSDSEQPLDELLKAFLADIFVRRTHKHDRSVIAQDAIEIIRDPSLIPEPLMTVAGKFFRRFDRSTCTFVSNIKEYFPDD